MKKNKIYIFMAMVLATLTTTACFDDQGVDTFFGGNQVEFNAGNLPNGLTTTQTRTSDTQTDILQVQVNRVSTSGTGAITVNIAVDPTSTAVSGVHYSLASNTVTIPAGEFVANFPVTILTGNISPSETPQLKLVMESATGADLSSNYADLAINIRVVCPSAISVATDVWAATGVSRFGTFTADVSVSPLGNGRYVISDISAGLYAAFGFGTIQEAIYSDNCNALTFVQARQTEFAISAPAVDPKVGSYDAATKTMVVYWSDPNNGINGTTTLVKK
jgi:hypothetical protein